MPRLSEIQAINLGDLDLPKASLCAEIAKELEAGEIFLMDEMDISKIAKLVMSGSISQLSSKERRCLPYLVMDKEIAEYNPKFARIVIEAESGKRGFYRSLFNAWLAFFPKDEALSKLIRATLSSKISKLREVQQKAIDIFKVLEKRPPFRELSKSILTNNISRESLELVKFSKGNSASEFARILIVQLAARMQRGRLNKEDYENFVDLVAPMELIHDSSKASALIGIVYPVRDRLPEDVLVKKARSVIGKNFADPRADIERWPRIPDILGGETAQNECIEQEKKWEIYQSNT